MDLKLIDDKGQAAVDGRRLRRAVRPRLQRSAGPPGRHRLPGERAQGTRAQKGRADINKSHKKPWAQKGTGRARAGQANSPLWRGGGKIFPNSPDENFSQKVNRKMYRAGHRVDPVAARARGPAVGDRRARASTRRRPSSSRRRSRRSGFPARVLVVTDKLDDNVFLSSRNLPDVLVLETRESRSGEPRALQQRAAHQGAPLRNSRRCWDELPPKQYNPERLDERAARAGRLREGARSSPTSTSR